uniref:Uncharacterized protein n=1 Tax=Arundo donax TaxID=35708 RepID=A0A0A9D4G6_ARUDO
MKQQSKSKGQSSARLRRPCRTRAPRRSTQTSPAAAASPLLLLVAATPLGPLLRHLLRPLGVTARRQRNNKIRRGGEGWGH